MRREDFVEIFFFQGLGVDDCSQRADAKEAGFAAALSGIGGDLVGLEGSED